MSKGTVLNIVLALCTLTVLGLFQADRCVRCAGELYSRDELRQLRIEKLKLEIRVMEGCAE